MKYQIDQSGKIEDTNKPTVLAYSNSSFGNVIVTAKVKRKLQEKFRLIGKPRLFVDVTFAVSAYLLVKPLMKSKRANPTLTIDIEYPGHTEVIRRFLKEFISSDIEIRWEQIGKGSKAHDIAYKTYKKKIKVDRILTLKEIWKLARKIAGGRLNTGLSPANRRSAPAIKKIIPKYGRRVK